MTHERLIDKIRKLLNLANNNSNEAEATAAAAKVQELLQENGLDMAAIGGGGETKNGPSFDHEKTSSKSAAMYRYQQNLMKALADNNFCQYWLNEEFRADPRGKKMGHVEGRGYVHGRDVKAHMVLGRKVNVMATLMTYDYLVATMDRLLPWVGMQKRGKEALQWLDGCTDRLVERLAELRREAIKENERTVQAEKTRAAHPSAAPSDGRALVVLQEVYSSEEDLNNDFRWGLEAGTTAKRRAENEAKSRMRQAKLDELMKQGYSYDDAWDIAWYGKVQDRAATQVSRPATEAERRRWENQQRRDNERAWRRYAKESERKNNPAYRQGAETGENISLNRQVGGAQKKLGR